MKPRQKKSRTYYYFWGAATVAVFAGQIYVGTGFRRMAVTLQRILDAPLMIEVPDLIPRGRYLPLVPPPSPLGINQQLTFAYVYLQNANANPPKAT